jgi:hypothetical protein
MASSSTRKHCANGNGCKQMAAALCEGCSQALCTKHFIDHRRFLGEEMNVIISEHDQFQHTLNQKTTNPESHPLITQIDEWEKKSIIKIRQKAKELREEFLQLITVPLDDLSKKLRHLSRKLKEGREEDSFVETDLRKWKKSLDNLKENLVSPSTFSISRQDREPLVQNIYLNLIAKNDIFERVFDNTVRISNDGQVAIHDASTGYTEIRGKEEYASDRHEIRLCIEQSADNWTFLGINSKWTLLENNSHWCKSACGWSNNNCLWLNGSYESNTSLPAIEMKTNDIISLIFNCDASKISMINQRTNGRYELDVNLENCPFPWQLHVILYEPNSRVRILSTSS